MPFAMKPTELVYDPMLGPAAPALGWVPAPRYLLRRQRILRALTNVAPSPVIEVGPGAGMMLQELADRGFRCHALETSAAARDLIERLCHASGVRIDVHASASGAWKGHFPLVMAFEVLEHIEDDRAALAQWADWLAPGGTLLISVPAHPRQWNAADVWAGHYRRYTRTELLERVAESGLAVNDVECIGFPLGNLTERMQAREFQRRIDATGDAGEREANNDRSGIDRAGLLKWYPIFRSWPGKLALRGAFAAQWATQQLPFGNGYLLRARKPG